MYYEEKVIDGVLNYRKSPTGEWIPMTPQQLTTKIMYVKSELKVIEGTLESIKTILKH